MHYRTMSAPKLINYVESDMKLPRIPIHLRKIKFAWSLKHLSVRNCTRLQTTNLFRCTNVPICSSELCESRCKCIFHAKVASTDKMINTSRDGPLNIFPKSVPFFHLTLACLPTVRARYWKRLNISVSYLGVW